MHFFRSQHIVSLAAAVHGPGEFVANTSSRTFDFSTCKEFEKGAHFSPEDVVDSLWRIFYYWADSMQTSPILFSLPSEKKVNTLKDIVHKLNPELKVDWINSVLFMEPRPGVQVMLISKGYAGAFRALVKKEHLDEDRPHRKPDIHLIDVRMNIVDRYLGIINCDVHTAFALARTYEMPQTEEECIAAVSSLGINAFNGKPYLFQKQLNAIDEL